MSDRAAHHDALAALIGRARARILHDLGTSSTTTQLAHRYGVTPGAVSHHMQALYAAGLTARQRDGHFVYYSRTPLGQGLVEGRITTADNGGPHEAASAQAAEDPQHVDLPLLLGATR